MALAQVEVDPAGELAAEDGVDQGEGGAIGMRTRRAPVADAQLGLRRARAIDHDHAAPARRSIELRRRRRRRRAEVGQRPLRRLLDSGGIDVANDQQRGAARRAPRAPEVDDLLAADRAQRRSIAEQRVAVRRVAVERRGERLFRQGSGLVAAAQPLGEPVAPLPLDLEVGEGWVERHVRQQREPGVEVGARGPAPTPRRSSSRRRCPGCRRATRSPRRSAARSGWWCRPRAGRR